MSTTTKWPATARLQWFLLVLLAACGGGGGSGSGSPGSPPPPPAPPPPVGEPPAPIVNYTGSRQSIVLTRANVDQLAFRAFFLRSVTQFVELQWVDPPQGGATGEDSQQGQFGGRVDVRYDIDATGRGWLEADFTDFSDFAGETINGRYVQRYRPETGQIGEFDYSFAGPGTLEFDDLTFAAGSEGTTLHGTVTITGVDSNAFLVDLVISELSTGIALYFEDCTLQFSDAEVGSSLRPAVEIDGAVFDQDDGGIAFASLGPIPDLGFNEGADNIVGGAGGGIELIAAGPVTHVRPVSFAFVSVIMDLDGDGAPETAKRFSWPALAGEAVVESSVMQGPIANAGNRRQTRPGVPVKVHGLFSHDDDGDWLTFEWQLLAKPSTSGVSVDDVATLPYFEFTPDLPGDYVFGLRASDGLTATRTSVVIRHAPAALSDVDDDPLGGLELGQPIAVSTPILVDGRSAMNWPYGQTPAHWSRSGFGPSTFDDTGDPASTYLTIETEGMHGLRFSHTSQFGGAIGSSADINLAIGPPVFETPIEIAGDSNAFDVHKLDYDNDGDEDLALRIGQNGGERILLLAATPDGLVPAAEQPAGIGELAYGDINGDGLADFLNATAAGLRLYVQAPDHSLSPPQSFDFPAAGCPSVGGDVDIALADVDADGRIDIVAVHPCEHDIVRWLQQPDGSFATPSMINFPDHRIRNADFGDIDGDGRTDVVAYKTGISTAFDDGISVQFAQPDGTLVEEYFLVTLGLSRNGGTIGDVDNDGRQDVVVVYGDEIILLHQQADGTLATSTIYSDPGTPSFEPAASLVDLDGDGRKDIYFFDSEPIQHLLLQDAGGSFRHVRGPGIFHMNLEHPGIAASLDVNGDGLNDLVALTDAARGALDERALLRVYLQGVRLYPL